MQLQDQETKFTHFVKLIGRSSIMSSSYFKILKYAISSSRAKLYYYYLFCQNRCVDPRNVSSCSFLTGFYAQNQVPGT